MPVNRFLHPSIIIITRYRFKTNFKIIADFPVFQLNSMEIVIKITVRFPLKHQMFFVIAYKQYPVYIIFLCTELYRHLAIGTGFRGVYIILRHVGK